MRPARLFALLLAVLTAGLLCAPGVAAEPPFRIPDYVTDQSGALSASERAQVETAVTQLYDEERIRLWVVYVDTFDQGAVGWARSTMQLSDFGDRDALLAVATVDRSYAFQVPLAIMSDSRTQALQRDVIEPALRDDDLAGAAVAAADGLGTEASGSGSGVSWVAFAIVMAIMAVAVFVLWLWSRRRRRKRREAEFAAAQRVDPSDPNALAQVPIDALDELSKKIVVEVDNEVRTSESELALAVEEFGERDTAAFTRAVTNAKTTLAQALNVRHILDDAVPETPQQRRDLLTRVIVAAAKADRELEAQREAFAQLRDLLINAPSRLDTLTQQMIDLTARLTPAEQTLARLNSQFAETALVSVSDNIEEARQRLTFAEQNIDTGRDLVSRPAGRQGGLIDAIHAAEASLGQARTLLDAVDSAATDINRAVAGLPAVIADIQNGISQAGAQLAQGDVAVATALSTARDAAVQAVSHAQSAGNADPL
ncbi:MAG: TPM domain-containing protein, partial [Mycobacterium sp.]